MREEKNILAQKKSILMEKKNLLKSLIGIRIILLAFVFLVLTLSSISLITAASSYVRSAPAYTFGHQTAPYTGGQLFPVFDRSQCQAGQDFILQVSPLGCTPSVVRSDLLEEQEVTVFCPISATQLNPLIKIKDINYMVISSKDLPREVLTVGYYPARAALGKWDPDINTPYFNNIGYAAIVLRRQPNESAMPGFVQGNLTAQLVYDVDNAFGTGRAVYYLQQLSDDEWNRNYKAYGFWDGRGYLRLEDADNNGATIGVYSDRDQTGTGRLGEKTRLTTLNLKEGEKSKEVYLPGFNYCMGGIELQLNDLENPDTRARLRIDSEVIETKAKENFLENKCTLTSITKQGVNQKVEISCKEDERAKKFSLTINPKIILSIDKTKAYEVGDFLYSDGDNSIYLGFIGNNKTDNSASGLYIRLISISTKTRTITNKDKLTASEISSIADYDKNAAGSDLREKAFGEISVIPENSKVFAKLSQLFKNLLKGSKIGYLHYDAPEDTKLAGKNLDIIGYSGVYDADLSLMPKDKEIMDNYEKAKKDYETIKASFSEDRYPPNDPITLGQQALENTIILANSLDQKSTVLQLCKEFSETYDAVSPDISKICEDEHLLSNTQTSEQSVVINGKTHLVSFEGVREPSFEEYGLEISVRSNSGEEIYSLSKNEILYLPDSKNNEYIQLTDLQEDTATLKTSLVSVNRRITTSAQLPSSTKKIKIGAVESFDSRYGFRISKIYLQKVAKVSINPKVNYARTNATINFKIGIEKRAIQLSPEKTKERIETLNKTIETWTKITNGVGKVVSAGKTACLVTAGALTIKNFFSNLGGKGIARQTVMKASGTGWYDKCQGMIKPKGQYENLDACLLNNSNAIDASVNAYQAAMDRQNQEMKRLEEGISKTTFLGEKVVITDELAKRLVNDNYRTDISGNLQGVFAENKITIGNEKIDINEKVIPYINTNTATISQARDLQLNSRLLSSSDPNVQEIAKSNVEKILGEIYSNSKALVARDSAISQFSSIGLKDADVYVSGNRITSYYHGDITSNSLGDLKSGVPAKIIVFDNTNYIVQLEKAGTSSYKIVNVFDASGKIQSGDIVDKINSRFVFETVDGKTYISSYSNPQVKYYETDPYRGLPAIVPFDKKNGWYAAVKSNLPVLGGLKAYGDSGRVSSFYVCNVGPNGREENIGGDDICRGFVPGANQPPDFPGLTSAESGSKMNQAVQAIKQATDQYKSGVSQVTVNGQRIDVGAPAANIPAINCQDFMSPTDCNIMFNVCDPFICPSSRCDLGGAYPVKDVIQSGIGGSIALCLPNWPEIKVPICISGVHAGLEGYRSVLSSYQQCLQTSLDTGQTVGICDELNSIYMCDFFWRQGLPLIKYAIPKVIGSVLGQNVRGGGEYLGVANAMSNAENSVTYFSQYYAANSFAAFKARSLESVGTEVCQNWVSLTGPKGNLFDSLIAPDSPPQFYGRFEEILYTTATNPPVSQYKVFYHIYSGKDLPAYYQVYLRGTSSSFYQDTDFRRPVATGFIKAGDFKSETIDFTAPSGYKELCIVVNGQEECGFKQVTTDFGVDYLSEKYVQEQASQTDIKTEAECVSGNPSAFSFLNPNLQAGAEEALNPAIYNRGITRVCSTENPGKTSDSAIGTQSVRWKQVGNCGSQNLKCWLDTDSVKDVIKNANIENQILGEIENPILAALKAEGNYMDNDAFDSFKKELEGLSDPETVSKINENIGKVYQNDQKAYLYLKRGNIYKNLATRSYSEEKAKREKEAEKKPTAGEQPTATAGTGEQPLTAQQCIDKFDTDGDKEITEIDCGSLEGTSADECPNCLGQKITEIVEQPTITEKTCTDIQSCRKVLGEEIIKLAKQKKQENGIIDDDAVKANTGAKSFECLALQVAMVESDIRHCIKTQENGNPLYCDGIKSSVLGGDAESGGSFGVMQINSAAHPDAFSSSPNVYSFEENVNYGLDHLIDGYNSLPLIYGCYMPEGYPLFGIISLASNGLPPSGTFEKTTYSEWKRAIRNYNGWNSKCWCYVDPNDEYNKCTNTKTSKAKVSGNPNYVDDVIAARDDVANLFPECGETTESVGVSYSKTELMGKSSSIKGLRSDVQKAFDSMKAAAKTDGFTITVVSGYRTFNRQLEIWNGKFESSSGTDEERVTKTAEFSAVPGMSRHHWGTEIDINSVDSSYWENNEVLNEWLAKNAPTYGFCQPYNKDRGVVKTEQWHWSYKPVSKQLTQQYIDTINSQDITGLDIKGENIISSNFEFYRNGFISNINPYCLS